jgi:apolipoprotein N-acyltransferase
MSAFGGPPDEPVVGHHRSARRQLLTDLVLALASGLLVTAAFPGSLDWWPLAAVAVAGLALAVRGRRFRGGFGLGYVFGIAFFVPHVHWSGIYVGLLPWMGLAGASALFLGALGAALTTIWRAPGGAAGTVLAGGSLWVLQEALRDRIPFGGFPWGRLAFSQSGAPTAGLAALGGAPLVTFAVAVAGTLLAWVVSRVLPAGSARSRRAHVVPAAGALVLAAAVTAAGSLVPLPTDGRPVRVAAVQGDVPEPGLDFNAERRAVLDNHARATLALAARVRAGTAQQPGLVLWPENASDIDPLANADAAGVIQEAVDAIRAPILVGAVVDGPGEYVSNTGIVWGPDGTARAGPGARYVKRHPAPFGEYIPYRSFFRRISTKVDLVRRDFVSGDRLPSNPQVMSMGPAKVGDVICFEVAYDGVVRDPVRQGADLLAVQTNNATFGFSDESVQQLAMSRLRAIETGRTVVHVSTVGVSAIIRPDGTVLQRTGLFEPAVMEATVPLRTRLTPATRAGEWPEGLLAGLGVVLLIAGTLAGRRTRRASAAGRSSTEAGNDRPGVLDPARPGGTMETGSSLGQVLVIIPTYNERENLPLIVGRLRTAVPGAHVLVADDNSPDGTGDLADELAGADPHVHVLHRPGKQGLGAAYLHGFQWGLEHGYDVLVEMDADGSHPPEQLPDLLSRIDAGADLALGSRWVPGGRVVNWPVQREILSRGGNLYNRLALGIGLGDSTGGFRAFRATALEKLELGEVASQGYCFQVDIALRAIRRGLRVDEVPITFVEREHGVSKMNRNIVVEAFWRVTQWGIRYRTDQILGGLRRLGRGRPGTGRPAG